MYQLIKKVSNTENNVEKSNCAILFEIKSSFGGIGRHVRLKI